MTIWRMHIVYWIPKATGTQSQYAILTVFHSSYGYTNALRCYIILRWPILFVLTLHSSIVKFSIPPVLAY
jgi:hypothetical protein